MWIMIIKKIPVSEEFQPEPLGIYWSTPWEITDQQLISVMNKNREYLKEICVNSNIEVPDKNNPLCAYKEGDIEFAVKKHKKLIIEKMQAVTYLNDWHGLEPNSLSKRRIIINNEAIGVFPHEYNALDSEKMTMYINDNVHTFQPSGVAKEEFKALTRYQKKYFDAALLDGCDNFQAQMVALGKDPECDFPPPLGWYKCREEYVSHFF